MEDADMVLIPKATYGHDVAENAAGERDDAIAIDDREPIERLDESMAFECVMGISENNGDLSPIQEQKSVDVTQSPINAPPPPVPEQNYNPPSPFPPRTIKREPNRRHDEPEEYENLERKKMKVYRKLFIEGHRGDSDLDLSDEDAEKAADTGERKDSFERDRAIDDNSNNLQNNAEEPTAEKSSSGLKRTNSQENVSTTGEAQKSKRAKLIDCECSSEYLSKNTSEESNISPKDASSSTTESIEIPGNGNTDNEESQTDTDSSESQQDFLKVTIQADVHTEDTDVVLTPKATYGHDVAENAAGERDDAIAIDDNEPIERLDESMAIECVMCISENNVDLSPIQEQKSVDVTQSPINVPPPPVLEQNYNPPSPLPPRTIEREPNRRHDEPEEYVNLERKKMKVYRKLFIEGHRGDSDLDLSDEDAEKVADTGERKDSFERDRTIEDDSNNLQNNAEEPAEKSSSGLKRTNSQENVSTTGEAQKSKRAKLIDCECSSEYISKSTSEESNISPKDASSSTTESIEFPGNGNTDNEESQTDQIAVNHNRIS